MKNILKDFVSPIDWLNTINGGTSLTAVRVERETDKFIINLSAPSVRPEAFHIFVKDGKLAVHSFLPQALEKLVESEETMLIPLFQRTFDIPSFVDDERIEAVYEEGRIRVLMPFKSKDEAPRRIDIQFT
jgi:HSP20 family protein